MTFRGPLVKSAGVGEQHSYPTRIYGPLFLSVIPYRTAALLILLK